MGCWWWAHHTIVVLEGELAEAFSTQQAGSGLRSGTEDVDPLEVPGGAAPHDVDFAATQGPWAVVGGDGDVADPVGFAVPRLTWEWVEDECLGDGDTCGGVEEGGDGVVCGVLIEHDLVKEWGFSVAARATVKRVLVVVEGVVGGLYEVAASEYEGSEVQVQWLQ